MLSALADRPGWPAFFRTWRLFTAPPVLSYVFYDAQGQHTKCGKGTRGARRSLNARTGRCRRSVPDSTRRTRTLSSMTSGSPDCAASQFGHIREALARHAYIQVSRTVSGKNTAYMGLVGGHPVHAERASPRRAR